MTLIDTLFPLGWQHYLLGGLTIGAGVALLYLFNGWVGPHRWGALARLAKIYRDPRTVDQAKVPCRKGSV